MIVAQRRSELVLVTQTDHAQLAARLLSLWRADGLPDHPRRSEILLATREHDCGWQGVDAAPGLDPESHFPVAFDRIASKERRRLWRLGFERYRQERPYASRLILHHGQVLHRRHRGVPAWDAFFAELDRRAEDLAADSDVSPADLERDYRFLQIADELSLLACGARNSTRLKELSLPLEGRSYRARGTLQELYLHPFPFAGATSFEVDCRRIPRQPYDPETLSSALLTTRWTRLTVACRPLSSSESSTQS